jgi:hypothetical protein
MSEATALERSPDSTAIRLWPRYKVNVPIRVIVSRPMKASIFDGRGTSLSEGGMALFAGAELRLGDQGGRVYAAFFIAPDTGGRQDLQSFRVSLRGGIHRGRQRAEAECGSTAHALDQLCHHRLTKHVGPDALVRTGEQGSPRFWCWDGHPPLRGSSRRLRPGWFAGLRESDPESRAFPG